MKTIVYADLFDQYNTSTKVWEGNLDAVPREGDVIFIFDGWGGAPVRRVYWELDDNSVELHINDPNGSYRDEMSKPAPKED